MVLGLRERGRDVGCVQAQVREMHRHHDGEEACADAWRYCGFAQACSTQLRTCTHHTSAHAHRHIRTLQCKGPATFSRRRHHHRCTYPVARKLPQSALRRGIHGVRHPGAAVLLLLLTGCVVVRRWWEGGSRSMSQTQRVGQREAF